MEKKKNLSEAKTTKPDKQAKVARSQTAPTKTKTKQKRNISKKTGSNTSNKKSKFNLKVFIPIVSIVLCAAIVVPLLLYFQPWKDDSQTFIGTPLRAEPVSAAVLNDLVQKDDKGEWEMNGISSETMIKGKKYSELPFRILDSYTDGFQNYYLVDMGCINNTHLSTSHLVNYNGQSPITASVTTTTSDSVAQATSSTISNSYSMTTSTGSTSSLNETLEVKNGFYLKQSFNYSTTDNSSSSTSSERATETAVEEILNTLNSTTTEFTVGEHGEKAGWYRYGLYAIVDIYFMLTTSSDNFDLVSFETASGIRTNTVLPHFEYSEDGSFDNAPLANSILDLPEGFWEDLPAPSKEGQNMFEGKISASETHSLYIDPAGSLWAFGYNDYGQLGDNSTTTRTSPVQIKAGTAFTTASAGRFHSMAIDTEGNLWAWGRNGDGQLGDFTQTTRTTPVKIYAKKKFAQVSAGRLHSMAIDVDGHLWTWGYNGNGELGNGNTSTIIYPTQITADDGKATKFKSISAGDYFSLAIDSDGRLWSFGLNAAGQLGLGEESNSIKIPTQVIATTTDENEITEFDFISAGNAHSLAIDASGNLWAFGYNQYGQLGNGTTTNTTSPVQITAGDGAVAKFKSIEAGHDYSMVVDLYGNLLTCGRNISGQLGDGTTVNKSSLIPVSASYIKFAAISAGQHCLAIDSNGELWVWGNNSYGQLGVGNQTNKNTPSLRSGI
ncbi:MAG: hypothetical protein LBF12_03310 [Christensenellaceae bacterium]|jgi:alpha-tubulin suppressor-like RCC1 family protein|nr:hypothetical protein [Christensenellaceae bacterium]